MRAKLKYKLPEEREDFILALNGSKYHSVLWDLEQDVLRKYEKYGIPPTADIKTPEDMVKHIRDEFYRIMASYGVSLYEVE